MFHDHALMLHYDDKTNNCIRRYVNLLQYERCEPPTCFGHLLWPSSGTFFYIFLCLYIGFVVFVVHSS
jgi:hypothetical protein